MNNNHLAIFGGKEIRRIIFRDEWWFSVVDVIQALTDQSDNLTSRKYWNKLSQRLRQEGSQVVTFCHQLKLSSTDGKMRLTDCANTEGLLRIIQSIPSPKAEPFKQWLARVGQERIAEIDNPELAMDRMKALYEKKGYPKEWIDKRARGIAVRHSLTDEWRERGANKSIEYAILTNEIMTGAFDLNVKEYKNIKGLTRENLRDHMNDMELILTMLGEATTTKLHQDRDTKGFGKLKKDATEGGEVAGNTRKDIEHRSGKKVVTGKNFLNNTRHCEELSQ